MRHVGESLVWTWQRKKRDEVSCVSFVQGHPDLGVVLEAADTGAVSGTRIDDDDRRLAGIDAISRGVFVAARDAQ